MQLTFTDAHTYRSEIIALSKNRTACPTYVVKDSC